MAPALKSISPILLTLNKLFNLKSKKNLARTILDMNLRYFVFINFALDYLGIHDLLRFNTHEETEERIPGNLSEQKKNFFFLE